MSTLSLRLPNSLHEQIRLLAKREGISINQFIASATAEKMTALLTEEYLNKRAHRASRKSFRLCWIKCLMLSLRITTGFSFEPEIVEQMRGADGV